MPESPLQKTARRLGSVTISPTTPIVAGSYTSHTITLTVGSLGIDEGGTIKLAQRFASDGEAPQFDRPKASGYTTVTTNGQAKLKSRYDRKAHDRPWSACIVIDVFDGSLAPGDIVTIILGDTSQGSPGIRAQTFQESNHDFRIYLDPTNACLCRSVAHWPKLPIIAGDPVSLTCLLPTRIQVNQPAKIFLKAQDQWENPTPAPKDTKLTYEGTGSVKIEGTTLTFLTPGSGLIRATSLSTKHQALSTTSNPITSSLITNNDSLITKYKPYWGDMHAQSDATVGTGSEVEYFTFARDWAALDFCSHQGNDFQMYESDWKRLNDVIRQFHKDHSFVVFPGWEWSGTSYVGGDRNVWYLEEDMPMFRSSHWECPEEPETDLSPADTAPDLFARIRQLPREKVLLGSHVGGRFADIRKFFDEDIGPLVELVSCWGIFEWMLWDAFDKNYVVGVVCNSDGHKGRPGAEGPGAGQFGIANGLTCVLATEQTRKAIFEALKARRCYGTTGARIDVSFTIDGHPMGSVISGAPHGNAGAVGGGHKLSASVVGTAPLESLEIFQGKTVLHTWRPAAFNNLASSNHIRVSWKGSRIRGRGRRANWDGKILLTPDVAQPPSAVNVPQPPSAVPPKILSATAHFDTPIDKITAQSDHEVAFISQTTGDTDWIDLTLSNASTGTVTLDSKIGRYSVSLADLTSANPSRIFPAGGLDMAVKIERYPQSPTESRASLSLDLPPVKQRTPYFIKVTQTDGHLAWTSPIYLA